MFGIIQRTVGKAKEMEDKRRAVKSDKRRVNKRELIEAVTEHNKNNKLDALVMHHTATRTGNLQKKARTNKNVAIAVAEMNLSIPKIPPVGPVTVKIPAGAAPK